MVSLLALGACSFSVPTAAPRDGEPVDGLQGGDTIGADSAIDGPSTDAPPSGLCFGEGNFIVCLTTLPGSALTFGATTIDTSGGSCPGETFTPTGGPQLCVVAGTTVTVNGLLRATGSRPLVLVATSGALTVTTLGAIDASSFRGGGTGAGTNYTGCPAPGNAANANNGAGGGAGGSFGTPGGNGGAGGGGQGGGATSAVTPTFLRGGCGGGNGGTASGGGGSGRDSGGAVYLLANTTLIIDGRIDASGSGGDGAPSGKGGGGGGGSGGMIALWGRTGIAVGVGAVVFANGAGGGGGADSNVGGSDGNESTGAAIIGLGGAGGATGAPGGAGAIGTAQGQSAAASGKGGGGGGGGVGVIKNVSGQSIIGGSFSPPI